MKLFGRHEREQQEVSQSNTQGSTVKSLLPVFILPYMGFAISIIWLNANPDMKGTLLGTLVFFASYAGGAGAGILTFFMIRAVQTEKGNSLKCLILTIKWALKLVTPGVTIFFEDPKPLGWIPCKLKADDIWNTLQKYKKKIAKFDERAPEEIDEKEKKDEDPPDDLAEEPEDEEKIFITKLPLTSEYVGYDEETDKEHSFTDIFMYTPGAPFTKHFPGLSKAEVPFGMAIINHARTDPPAVDCIGWSHNPTTGEWTPHFFVMDSIWYSIALRRNIKLPKVTELHKAMVYTQEMGEVALALKTELRIVNRELDDLLEKEPQTVNKLVKRDLDETHAQEGTIFKEMEENPRNWWMIMTIAFVIIGVAALLTRMWGLW